MKILSRLIDPMLWYLLLPSITSLLLLVLTFYLDIPGYLFAMVVVMNMVVVIYGVNVFYHRFSSKIANLSTVIDALKSEDYSTRIKSPTGHDSYSRTANSLNQLVTQLATQSVLSRERQVLLAKITKHIDIGIVACDHRGWITLMNPAAEKLFGTAFSTVKHIRLSDLNLPSEIVMGTREVITIERQNSSQKVYLSSDEYFEYGKKQQLYFFADVQSLLLEEERKTWQKLVRVLSHELNNSLTPITSISHSLAKLITSSELDSALHEDLSDGIGVINERSRSLATFLNSYEKFTKLPSANRQPIEVNLLVDKVCQLFPKQQINNQLSSQSVYVDVVQVEQVLLNLLKNASEAMQQNLQGSIAIEEQLSNSHLIISIRDQGTGIHNIDNMFVPFYTTKPKGSGIGLVLSRMIANNNEGQLSLKNNSDGVGATAYLSLPLVDNQ